MKEDEYRRRNIRKAWQVWMAMPPEQRKRRPFSNETAAEPGPPPPYRDEEAQDQQRNPREIRGQGRAFGGDAVAYYQEHYAGLTRGQLHDQAPRFYDYLRRHGLLGHIPLKPKVRFPDPLDFLPGTLRRDDAPTASAGGAAVLFLPAAARPAGSNPLCRAGSGRRR
jgi:hypothetical protein